MIFNNRSLINNTLPYIYQNNTVDNIDNISLDVELYRYDIIQGLFDLFTKELKLLKIPRIDLLYKYNKINDIIQKWCWDQYSNSTVQDSVIPYVLDNKYNYDTIVENINYVTGNKLDYSDYLNIITNVSTYLENRYITFKNKKKNKVKYTKTNDSNFNIIIISIGNNKKLELEYLSKNIILKIHNDLYQRLENKLKMFSPKLENSKYEQYIIILVLRYYYMGSNNQQLAIHKNIKYMFKTFGVNFELFGSAINVINDYYCSLFYDIEKYFGSQGNFFNIEITQGIYWCNPPYINYVMSLAATKLVTVLLNNNNVGFIVTIPIWDSYTQNKKISKMTKNININENVKLFSDYKVYYILKPYIRAEIAIPKKTIPYFNYRKNKEIFAVDTYMILLYSDSLNEQYKIKLNKTFDKILNFNKA